LAAYQSVLNPQSGSLGNAGSAGNAGNGGERWEVRGGRWEVFIRCRRCRRSRCLFCRAIPSCGIRRVLLN